MIFAMVKDFAKNNLAFCGDNEKIGDAINGCILCIIGVLNEFDLVMKEHI